MSQKISSARLDEVLRALADGDRRRALYFIGEHGSVSRTELIDVLTGWRSTDDGVDVVDGDDWERTALALRHLHLPALAEAGLVDYDDETVSLAEFQPWVGECLDLALRADESIEEAAVPVDRRDDGE